MLTTLTLMAVLHTGEPEPATVVEPEGVTLDAQRVKRFVGALIGGAIAIAIPLAISAPNCSATVGTCSSAFQNFSLGIMPLVDNENGRAKCAFKMLQYMGCALPSIVTPIGLNSDLLATGNVGIGASATPEWIDALEQLYSDRDAATAMGAEGRRIATERFARPAIAKDLAKVFREVTGV